VSCRGQCACGGGVAQQVVADDRILERGRDAFAIDAARN
jgi:hypothetical protein